ncbi:MAG: hypothetical protein J6Y67_01515 [Lachnospiraceae bacterium]|nr:hypothetical protein [Lachnospiraceae bacterium]
MGFFSSLFGPKEAPAPAAQPFPAESLPANGVFANMFKIDEAFQIAPKATEVGIKRAKLYKDRIVVRGPVTAGSFSQNDAVVLFVNGSPMLVPILDVMKCGDLDFASELAANMHKHTIEAGMTAWIILDLTSLPVVGTTIGKF